MLSSVQFSHSVVSDSLRPHEPQHARPPRPSPAPRVHPNPCSLSWWHHPTISSFVVPFSSCPQSFPATGSFPMSQLFAWGGQSIGASASTSVLPMNTQDWSPLGWVGWISLQSNGLSGVFSNTTVQKHPYSVSHWWVQQACIEHRADYIICKSSTVWKCGSQGWGCPAGSHLHVDTVERCWSLMTSAWKRWRWRWRWAEKEAESLSPVNN